MTFRIGRVQLSVIGKSKDWDVPSEFNGVSNANIGNDRTWSGSSRLTERKKIESNQRECR
jgi:hypothetical protein